MWIVPLTNALMGCNTTGPPCSVGRHREWRPARSPPAALQTPTDTSEQNSTGPLGGPLTSHKMGNFEIALQFRKSSFPDWPSVFI